MTDTISFDGSPRACQGSPAVLPLSLSGSAPGGTRGAVRYVDRNWNEISANQIGQDLSECEFAYAIRQRPSSWGMPRLVPNEPQFYRPRPRPLGPSEAVLRYFIAKRLRDLGYSHLLHIGPYWLDLHAAVDEERRRLLEQSAFAARE